MKRIGVVCLTVGALLLPASAQAHITLQPNTAAAKAFTVLDVRVPNERDNASTTKVDLKLPPGFLFASYQPVPGWKAKVVKEKLAQPVKTEDGEVTEQVREIIWTGGAIAPGQYEDFPLSVQMPGKAGQVLTFKAVQTYSNGEVVRWIGPPDAEEPAPRVKLTTAVEEGAFGPTSGQPVAATNASSTADDNSGDDDGPSTGLVIAALVLGGLGLLTGGAALLRGRST